MELYNELPLGCDWDFSCLHNSSFSAQRLSQDHIDIMCAGEPVGLNLLTTCPTLLERERERSHRSTDGADTQTVDITRQCYDSLRLYLCNYCWNINMWRTTSIMSAHQTVWRCFNSELTCLSHSLDGEREPEFSAQHMVAYQRYRLYSFYPVLSDQLLYKQ